MAETRPHGLLKAFLASINQPFLIWMAPVVLCVEATLGLLFTVVAAVSRNLYISLDQTPNGSLRIEFIVALMVLNASVGFSSAWGFSRERVWARTVYAWGSLLCFVVLLLFALIEGVNARAALYNSLGTILLLLFQFWYLYRHRPVQRYYARLAADAL